MEGDEAQKKYDDARAAAMRARVDMPRNVTPPAAELAGGDRGHYASEMKLRAVKEGASWTACMRSTRRPCRLTT